MQNLPEFRDEIKAALAASTGTPLARLVTLLAAAGITATTEVAALCGVTDRAIRKARPGTPVPPDPEPQFRPGTPVPPKRNPSSAHPGTPVPLASRACINTPVSVHATFESPSEMKDIRKKEGKEKGGVGEKTAFRFQPIDALEAFGLYNETALRCGIPQAAKLTPSRRQRILARLNEFGLDGWRKALDAIEHSAFLTGDNDRGWRADLDFLCQAKSFARCVEGGYGNGRATPATIADIHADAAARFELERQLDVICGGVQ